MGRARYAHGKSKVAIQGDDDSSNSGFHVGHFYQMSKMPSDLESEIKKLDSRVIGALNIPVVCVRIEELRKRIGKTYVLRSSESKKSVSSTTAIVTEFVPHGTDDTGNCVAYTREECISNVAPVPLANLGAEMEMQQLLTDVTGECMIEKCADDKLKYRCIRLVPGNGGEAAEPLSVEPCHLENLKNQSGQVKPFLKLKVADLKALLNEFSPSSTTSGINQAELRLKVLHAIAKKGRQQEMERRQREAFFRTQALRAQAHAQAQAQAQVEAEAWQRHQYNLFVYNLYQQRYQQARPP